MNRRQTFILNMFSRHPQKKGGPDNTSIFDLHLIRRFLGYLKSYRKLVFLGAAAIPFTILCSILFPWLIMHITDTRIVTQDSDGLFWWSVLLLLVLVGNYGFDALFSFSLQKSALLALRDMRSDMFSRVLAFPRHYFDRTPIGVILTRLTSDLEAVNESFAQGLLSMVRDVFTTLALLVFLFFINWKLALMVLLLGPPTYLVTELLRRKLRAAYAESRVVLSQGTGYLQECLNGIKTVQLYSAEKQVQHKYKGFTQSFFHAQSRSNFYDAALFSIIDGLTTIAMALIIWLGAKEILAATISYGVLIGFTQTLDRIFVPVRDFTSQIASIQRALAAFGHIEEIFTQPVQGKTLLGDDSALLRHKGKSGIATIGIATIGEEFESLVFEDVSFRYKKTGPLALNGINFTLNKGDKLALVGSTGSGKSTIIRLLTKTYDDYEGSIRLNGLELRHLSIDKVSAFFSLMQQDVFLFNKSVSFNIGLNREGIGSSEIEDAARYVYADGFIQQLPGGFDFTIQGNGNNLSAGQGQLIAFARAIASGSEVVLLDEATSSVDSVTEQLIQQAIDHVFTDKTVIAIAHRLSTIQHSDLILVMDRGQIVERGNHQNLINMDGFYARLLKEKPGEQVV